MTKPIHPFGLSGRPIGKPPHTAEEVLEQLRRKAGRVPPPRGAHDDDAPHAASTAAPASRSGTMAPATAAAPQRAGGGAADVNALLLDEHAPARRSHFPVLAAVFLVSAIAGGTLAGMMFSARDDGLDARITGVENATPATGAKRTPRTARANETVVVPGVHAGDRAAGGTPTPARPAAPAAGRGTVIAKKAPGTAAAKRPVAKLATAGAGRTPARPRKDEARIGPSADVAPAGAPAAVTAPPAVPSTVVRGAAPSGASVPDALTALLADAARPATRPVTPAGDGKATRAATASMKPAAAPETAPATGGAAPSSAPAATTPPKGAKTTVLHRRPPAPAKGTAAEAPATAAAAPDDLRRLTDDVVRALGNLTAAGGAVTERQTGDLRSALAALVDQALTEGRSHDEVAGMLEKALAATGDEVIPDALRDASGRVDIHLLLASVIPGGAADHASGADRAYVDQLRVEGERTTLAAADGRATARAVPAGRFYVRNGMRYTRIRRGDTLSSIAYAAYGDVLAYPLILQANAGRVSVRGLRPGMEIAVPLRSRALRRPTSIIPRGAVSGRKTTARKATARRNRLRRARRTTKSRRRTTRAARSQVTQARAQAPAPADQPQVFTNFRRQNQPAADN